MPTFNIDSGSVIYLAELQKQRCLYCQGQLKPGRNVSKHSRTTTEHIVPRCWGGPSRELYNLSLACWRCNQLKGTAENEILIKCFGRGQWPKPIARLRWAAEMAILMGQPGVFENMREELQEPIREVTWAALPHILEVLAYMQINGVKFDESRTARGRRRDRRSTGDPVELERTLDLSDEEAVRAVAVLPR